MVEQVEGPHDKVQLPMLANFEELQYAQVQLRLIAGLQRERLDSNPDSWISRIRQGEHVHLGLDG